MASASHLVNKLKNYKVSLPSHCPFHVDLGQGAAGLDVRQLWTPGRPMRLQGPGSGRALCAPAWGRMARRTRPFLRLLFPLGCGTQPSGHDNWRTGCHPAPWP